MGLWCFWVLKLMKWCFYASDKKASKTEVANKYNYCSPEAAMLAAAKHFSGKVILC
ncbi:hypothetical protein CASFOL_020716 [Castilleja foliolosa]|uniref:Uncharacterized protein n=1 Tax=Castilleja foliolosa TaxID=1961234 RepID=A0ABD3D4F9_9LAMI